MPAGRPVLIIILVLAAIGLIAMAVLPPILDPVKPEIPYQVLEHKSEPPEYFSYVLTIEPKDGKLPPAEAFMAVTKTLADKSLMEIGAVNYWRIAYRLASAPDTPAFLVYTYDMTRDRFSAIWHPQNLPPELRSQAQR